jgi:hypothetical protein
MREHNRSFNAGLTGGGSGKLDAVLHRGGGGAADEYGIEMRVLPTRAVSLGSGLPTRGLLHRMRDFSEGEDKLQCLLLALVLLGRASLGSADGLLDALQRALRPMCLEGLAADAHAIECHVALQCSSCGEEAYALLSLRAAIVARRQAVLDWTIF